MDYSDYYEQDFNGNTMVTLDYTDPEPSLYKKTKITRRPTNKMSGEHMSQSIRTSKRRIARNSQRGGFQQQGYEDDEYEDDEYEDGRDDDRSMYDTMTSRVNIQDGNSGYGNSGRQNVSDRSMRSNSSPRSRRNESPRSVAGGRSTTGKLKSKIDLTRPDSDTSFELFASLLVQHIEPKVERDSYTLDTGDMSYLEAIIPESLRLPFVEAVRVRSMRLEMEPGDHETALEESTRKCSELGLGHSDENNFLLGGGEKIGGGKIVMRLVDHRKKASNEDDYPSVKPTMTREEALAQVEAAYSKRETKPNQKPRRKERASNRRNRDRDESDSKTSVSGESLRAQEDDIRAKIDAARRKSKRSAAVRRDPTPEKRQDEPSDAEVEWIPKNMIAAEQNQIIPASNGNEGYQPPSEVGGDDTSVASSSLGSMASSHLKPVTPPSRKARGVSRKVPKPRGGIRNVSTGSLLGDSALLNKEALIADAIDEENSIDEPIFDETVKKTEEAEARAKARRLVKKKGKGKGAKNKKKKFLRSSYVSSTISVNTSPSDLDMTVAAFEHEWRDGLVDIFAHGIFHPHIFLALWAPISHLPGIVALGQVMTRLKLNWLGSQQTERETKDIFRKFGTVVASWAAINVVTIIVAVCFSNAVSGFIDFLMFLCVMSNIWFYSFCVFITGNTRFYLRKIYNINDTSSSDYMLAALYMPLVVAQMARHTADYNTLRGRLCTPSGLSEEADYSFIANVGTFGSYGSYKSFAEDDDNVSVTGSIASSYAGGSVSASTYATSVGGSTYGGSYA